MRVTLGYYSQVRKRPSEPVRVGSGMPGNQGPEPKLRRFCVTGMIVASLEEFISQGVLKRNLIGWIIPTFIAFFPYLVGAWLIHGLLQKRLKTGNRIELGYYGISGAIGLLIEWFLIGLSPWNNSASDPFLAVIFQLSMFSFWGTVAFVPRILQDKRILARTLVRWLKRCLAGGFLLIYFVTLTSSRQTQFIAGILSIMVVFLLLNAFYFKYFLSWRPVSSGNAPPTSPP